MTIDLNSYELGRATGKAEGSGGSSPYAGVGTGLFDRLQQERKTVSMKDDILALKKRLSGAFAMRDALKNALREVAPNHPLINPMHDNPVLNAVIETGRAKITSADDKV